jgi:hypothetical protein
MPQPSAGNRSLRPRRHDRGDGTVEQKARLAHECRAGLSSAGTGCTYPLSGAKVRLSLTRGSRRLIEVVGYAALAIHEMAHDVEQHIVLLCHKIERPVENIEEIHLITQSEKALSFNTLGLLVTQQ